MRTYRADGDYVTFQDVYRTMKSDMLNQPLESVGQWQSQDTDIKTRELMGVMFEFRVPCSPSVLAGHTQCNLSWAEDHFQERVSGLPLNPPPSEAWWPFNQEQNKQHKMQKDGTVAQFSHTYPERFWPKRANEKERCQYSDFSGVAIGTGTVHARLDLGGPFRKLSRVVLRIGQVTLQQLQ